MGPGFIDRCDATEEEEHVVDRLLGDASVESEDVVINRS